VRKEEINFLDGLNESLCMKGSRGQGAGVMWSLGSDLNLELSHFREFFTLLMNMQSCRGSDSA
jgi:hypothetical protein